MEGDGETGDRVLSSTTHTARKEHVCDYCECAGIKVGDTYSKLVMLGSDDDRFLILRHCQKKGDAFNACIDETERVRHANIDAMNEAWSCMAAEEEAVYA